MAAFLKEVKERLFMPNSSSLVSVYAKLSPKTYVSASAFADDTVEWPHVYSGKGGVCKYGTQFWSIYLFVIYIIFFMLPASL